MDGVSVYQARVNMGITLAEKVARELPLDDIDVVMPISRHQPPQRDGIGTPPGQALSRRLD